MNKTPTEDLGQRAAVEERLLRKRKTVKRGAIQSVARDGPLPTSPAQRRMWVHDRLVEDPAVNNVCRAERLRGEVSPQHLRRAFDQTVQRHETLRFCFEFDGQDLWTKPAERLPEFHHVALDVPTTDRDVRCAELYSEHCRRPFDLSSDAPASATLYQFSADDFLFVLVVHHIACDEWSVRRLQSEIRAQYEASQSDRAANVPALPVQYADFAAWQLQGLTEGRWSEAEAYWKSHLEGAPLHTGLPYSKPAPTAHEYGLAIEECVSVSKETADRLDGLGRERGATPFMVTLAATLAILHRLTGETDIAVSSMAAGRPHPELDGLIGMFTNNTVIRSQLTGGESYADVLERTRDLVFSALRYQDYPFDAMLNAMGDRRTDRPFADVMFTHREDFAGSLAFEGLRTSEVSTRSKPAKFNLWVSIIDRKDTRDVRLIADGNLFSRDGLARLARDLVTFFEDVTTQGGVAPIEMPASGDPLEEVSVDTDPITDAPHASDPATLQTIASLWRMVLGQHARSENASFFDEGGDSLLLLQLVHRMSEATGVEVPLRAAFADPTIAGHARLLDALSGKASAPSSAAAPAQIFSAASEDDPAVVPLTPDRADLGQPYFIVSGAGGHVLPFAPMAQWLTASWRGYGILDPGFFADASDMQALDDTARWMAKKLVNAVPEGPLFLVGYSYGAHVAFEMAAQLRQAGRAVGLVILDTRRRRGSLRRMIKEVSRSARGLGRKMLVQTSNSGTDQVRDGDIEALYDESIRQERTRRRALGARQRAMMRRYRPKQLDVPIVLIRSRDQIMADDRPDYGWSDLAPVLAVHDVEGNHLNHFKGSREAGFAKALEESLECLLQALRGNP